MQILLPAKRIMTSLPPWTSGNPRGRRNGRISLPAAPQRRHPLRAHRHRISPRSRPRRANFTRCFARTRRISSSCTIGRYRASPISDRWRVNTAGTRKSRRPSPPPSREAEKSNRSRPHSSHIHSNTMAVFIVHKANRVLLFYSTYLIYCTLICYCYFQHRVKRASTAQGRHHNK